MQVSFSNQLATGSGPPKAALQRELVGPHGASQVLRLEDQKSQPKEQAKEVPKEKQKRLVQLQKKSWQQKEKEKLQSQINEQQRILKNLQNLDKSARTRVWKAYKQFAKEQQHAKQKPQAEYFRELEEKILHENRDVYL